MGRRLMGSRVPGALGLAAAMSLIAGCDSSPDYDYSRICVTKSTETRVDDRYCAGDDGDRPTSAYGWYYQQFPASSYAYDPIDDDYYDTTPDLIVVGNGARATGGGFARPQNLNTAKVLTAPPVASGLRSAPIARSGGVVRGGFGAPSARGSAGS